MEERIIKHSQKYQQQKRKYAINETENDEPLVTDNPVINEPIYFNFSKSGIIS